MAPLDRSHFTIDIPHSTVNVTLSRIISEIKPDFYTPPAFDAPLWIEGGARRYRPIAVATISFHFISRDEFL